jgi:hypothetical protein
MTRPDEQYSCNSSEVCEAERRLGANTYLSIGYAPRGMIPARRKRRWKSCATFCAISIARAVCCGAGW